MLQTCLIYVYEIRLSVHDLLMLKMELLILLFFIFGSYWFMKSIKKNMFDPLDERIKKLEKLVAESKPKRTNKYD